MMIAVKGYSEKGEAKWSTGRRPNGDFMSWAADAYLMKSSDLTELKAIVKHLVAKRKERMSLIQFLEEGGSLQ